MENKEKLEDYIYDKKNNFGNDLFNLKFQSPLNTFFNKVISVPTDQIEFIKTDFLDFYNNSKNNIIKSSTEKYNFKSSINNKGNNLISSFAYETARCVEEEVKLRTSLANKFVNDKYISNEDLDELKIKINKIFSEINFSSEDIETRYKYQTELIVFSNEENIIEKVRDTVEENIKETTDQIEMIKAISDSINELKKEQEDDIETEETSDLSEEAYNLINRNVRLMSDEQMINRLNLIKKNSLSSEGIQTPDAINEDESEADDIDYDYEEDDEDKIYSEDEINQITSDIEMSMKNDDEYTEDNMSMSDADTENKLSNESFNQNNSTYLQKNQAFIEKNTIFNQLETYKLVNFILPTSLNKISRENLELNKDNLSKLIVFGDDNQIEDLKKSIESNNIRLDYLISLESENDNLNYVKEKIKKINESIEEAIDDGYRFRRVINNLSLNDKYVNIRNDFDLFTLESILNEYGFVVKKNQAFTKTEEFIKTSIESVVKLAKSYNELDNIINNSNNKKFEELNYSIESLEHDLSESLEQLSDDNKHIITKIYNNCKILFKTTDDISEYVSIENLKKRYMEAAKNRLESLGKSDTMVINNETDISPYQRIREQTLKVVGENNIFTNEVDNYMNMVLEDGLGELKKPLFSNILSTIAKSSSDSEMMDKMVNFPYSSETLETMSEEGIVSREDIKKLENAISQVNIQELADNYIYYMKNFESELKGGFGKSDSNKISNKDKKKLAKSIKALKKNPKETLNKYLYMLALNKTNPEVKTIFEKANASDNKASMFGVALLFFVILPQIPMFISNDDELSDKFFGLRNNLNSFLQKYKKYRHEDFEKAVKFVESFNPKAYKEFFGEESLDELSIHSTIVKAKSRALTQMIVLASELDLLTTEDLDELHSYIGFKQ